jgi:hypothetical protein
MSYFKPLLTFGYWFGKTGAPFVGRAMIVVAALIVLALVAGLVFKYIGYRSRRNPPLYRVLSRAGRAALWIAVIGAVLFGFTYEQIPYVSARFWWLLLIAGAIWWKIAILIDWRTRYRREKAALAERRAKEKYLPK